MTRLFLLLGFAIVLAGCATDGGPVDEAVTSTDAATAESSPVGAADDTDATPVGEFRCEPATGGTAETLGFLTDVSATDRGSFTRIVFEFEPAPGQPAAVPSFRTSYTPPPFREDPSDLPLDLEGSVALEIRFFNATGVDLSGTEPRVVYTGPKTIPLESPLTALTQSGDFEATLSWLAGMERQLCHAVAELDGPPRLVVDISKTGGTDFTG